MTHRLIIRPYNQTDPNTKEPTEELSRIHDRMPLILPESKINEWINPEINPEKIATEAVNEMVIEALD